MDNEQKKTISDLEIEHNIEYCVDILDKKFDFTHVENVCWIIGGYEDDSCYEHCYKCGEEKVEKGISITKSVNRKLRRKGLPIIELPFLDGGWGGASCGGQEGPVHCEECSIALDYSLSSNGVMEECNHFLEHGFDEVSNEIAFELYRIFYDGSYNKYNVEDKKKLGRLAKKVLETLGEIISSNLEVIDLD